MELTNCLAAPSAEQDVLNTTVHLDKDYNQFNITITNNDDHQESWQVHEMHCCRDRLEERGIERGSASQSSLKRTREGHRQSDEHRNCFKSKVGNF